MNPTLSKFSDPHTLCLVDRLHVSRVLALFQDCLPPEAIPLLDCDLNYEQFCAAWAAYFSKPERLGARLVQTLMAIEAVALPENHLVLEAALDNLPEGFSVKRGFCSLDQALHLWLIAQATPGVVFPSVGRKEAPPRLPNTTDGSVPPQPATCNVQPATDTPPSMSPPALSIEHRALAIQHPAPSIGNPVSGIEHPVSSTSHSVSSNEPPAPQPATCNLQPATDIPPEPTALETEEQALARLARLPLVEYERLRKSEAHRLHLRVGALDAEVEKLRAQLEFETQTRTVDLKEFEPWPEPVDLADTLDQVRARFNAYLALPAGASIALTLWDAHTFAPDAFHISPRLNLQSAEGGAGKTTTLDVIGTMVPRALRTESLSQAVLYRVVHQFHPVLELDEGDTYLHNDELRGLLNAGHKRGSRAIRCNGEGYGVRGYNAYAPCVLAGLGSLPATLRDRSIIIPLVAAEPGQIAVRFDSRHVETETILARKLARWFKDNFAKVAACDPPMPPGAFNRIADNWRPLFAIAHLAGGHWPELAVEAYNQLAHLARPNRSNGAASNTSAAPATDGTALLSDIRDVFIQLGVTRLFSSDLVIGLRALENRSAHFSPQKPDARSADFSPQKRPSSTDAQSTAVSPQKRPWSTGNKPLTESALARLLLPHGIRPHPIRIGTRQSRGYDLADFTTALAHLDPPWCADI